MSLELRGVVQRDIVGRDTERGGEDGDGWGEKTFASEVKLPTRADILHGLLVKMWKSVTCGMNAQHLQLCALTQIGGIPQIGGR